MEIVPRGQGEQLPISLTYSPSKQSLVLQRTLMPTSLHSSPMPHKSCVMSHSRLKPSVVVVLDVTVVVVVVVDSVVVVVSWQVVFRCFVYSG